MRKNYIDHVADPGTTRAVRASLDHQGIVKNEYPTGPDFNSIEEAREYAEKLNANQSHKRVDRDVIRLYDDKGNWVGGWSMERAQADAA